MSAGPGRAESYARSGDQSRGLRRLDRDVASRGLLDEVDGVSRVTIIPAARTGHSLVSAAVLPAAVDTLLKSLGRLGVPEPVAGVLEARIVEFVEGHRSEFE